MYDVAIVGGGIVGMSAAYHAVQAGARTLLVDRADVGYATAAGAGILAPETSGVESEDWFRLALTAVDYYPNLVSQLQSEQAGETGYSPVEALVVAVSEDEDQAFAAAVSRVRQRQARYGRPQPQDLAEVDGQTAQQLFPALAPIRSALHLRRAARVDGRLLTAALRQAALNRGLAIRSSSVDRLLVEGNTVTGVEVAGEQIAAANVIIAGGAWSPELGEQLGVTLPVTPQRGQIIHLSLPGVPTAEWPVVLPFHGHYILPWPDSRVVVGATRESSAGFTPHTTAAGIREVLSEALRVAPGLAGASIADIRVGLRPGTADNIPVLGRIPEIEQCFLATGHGANGLLGGPISGKLVVEQALGQALSVSIEAFSIARFQH